MKPRLLSLLLTCSLSLLFTTFTPSVILGDSIDGPTAVGNRADGSDPEQGPKTGSGGGGKTERDTTTGKKSTAAPGDTGKSTKAQKGDKDSNIDQSRTDATNPEQNQDTPKTPLEAMNQLLDKINAGTATPQEKIEADNLWKDINDTYNGRNITEFGAAPRTQPGITEPGTFSPEGGAISSIPYPNPSPIEPPPPTPLPAPSDPQFPDGLSGDGTRVPIDPSGGLAAGIPPATIPPSPPLTPNKIDEGIMGSGQSLSSSTPDTPMVPPGGGGVAEAAPAGNSNLPSVTGGEGDTAAAADVAAKQALQDAYDANEQKIQKTYADIMDQQKVDASPHNYNMKNLNNQMAQLLANRAAVSEALKKYK